MIYEFEGLRTYRRSHASATMARAIASALWPNSLTSLKSLTSTLRGNRSFGATYLSVQRTFPFEYRGLVYTLKDRIIMGYPGKLEDFAPPERKPGGAAAIADLVRSEMAKLEPLVSVYALREEARKLLDGVEERLMKKISEEVKKAIDNSR